MKRKREIVLLAHCLLNCNAKVEGLADYQGVHFELVKYLAEKGCGIIQLPCPEMHVMGSRRWGHVVEQLDTPHFRKTCRKLLNHIIDQVVDYKSNGYEIKAVIGIDYSPSCGVSWTCSSNKWKGELDGKTSIKEAAYVKGKGILMQELEMMLQENNVQVSFVGLNEKDLQIKSLDGVI